MGSHQELLAQRGLYWKLYQLQYKDQEVGAFASALPRTLRRDRQLTAHYWVPHRPHHLQIPHQSELPH